MKWAMIVATVFFVGRLQAHEGHNHAIPGAAAPRGGWLKDIGSHHVEVLSSGTNFKIYFYDHDIKSVSLEGIDVKAHAEIPRRKGRHEISLTKREGYFEGTFDAKGAHRYTLYLDVTSKEGGPVGKLDYVIEPKRSK